MFGDLYSQYRIKHGIPFPDEIRSMRKDMDSTMFRLAKSSASDPTNTRNTRMARYLPIPTEEYLPRFGTSSQYLSSLRTQGMNLEKRNILL